jgi:hypothetical protein
MGELKYLMIHCASTPPGRDVDKRDIISWHTDPKPKGRGWSVPGYSRLIKLGGEVQTLVEQDGDKWIEAGEITNGAAGYNGISEHICFAGGADRNGEPLWDDFDRILTPEQFVALEQEVMEWLGTHQDLQVGGHNQFNEHKYCPGFDMREFLRFLGVPEKNIYQEPVLFKND